MKYLFVIYTDIEYKKHLDYFKKHKFYQQICDDPKIEVIEWGKKPLMCDIVINTTSIGLMKDERINIDFKTIKGADHFFINHMGQLIITVDNYIKNNT